MKMIKSNIRIFGILLQAVVVVFLLSACGNLQQEVEIDLPDYESRPVLECYLEPGKPFRLLITKSSPYFDPFPDLTSDFFAQLLEEEADVEISHNGISYVLENELRFDPASGKLYNYYNQENVPFDTINPFELKVTLSNGNTITAETKLLPVIPIDSIVVEVAEEGDTLARALTYFTDRSDEANFYRRTFHESTLDSIPLQDFSVDDRIVEDVIVFGTGFDYEKGDTIISTIFHIDEAYYDFLETLNAAVAGNGNPFAQPSPVASRFGGTANALGIFTCLSYDRKVVIIEF